MVTAETDIRYEKTVTYTTYGVFGLLVLFSLYILDLSLYYKWRPELAKPK